MCVLELWQCQYHLRNCIIVCDHYTLGSLICSISFIFVATMMLSKCYKLYLILICLLHIDYSLFYIHVAFVEPCISCSLWLLLLLLHNVLTHENAESLVYLWTTLDKMEGPLAMWKYPAVCTVIILTGRHTVHVMKFSRFCEQTDILRLQSRVLAVSLIEPNVVFICNTHSFCCVSVGNNEKVRISTSDLILSDWLMFTVSESWDLQIVEGNHSTTCFISV